MKEEGQLLRQCWPSVVDSVRGNRGRAWLSRLERREELRQRFGFDFVVGPLATVFWQRDAGVVPGKLTGDQQRSDNLLQVLGVCKADEEVSNCFLLPASSH